MNNKAQVISIIFFIATLVTIFLMAPILMKIVITPSQKFSTALSSIDSTNKSVNAVDFTISKFTQTFDWVVLFFIMFSIVLLLISSFLVDAHPAFFILYFIAMFLIMIFAPMTLNFLDRMYDCTSYQSVAVCSSYGGWSSEIAYLPITKFIYDNFAVFILGVMFLSGIIMYAKYKRSDTGY